VVVYSLAAVKKCGITSYDFFFFSFAEFKKKTAEFPRTPGGTLKKLPCSVVYSTVYVGSYGRVGGKWPALDYQSILIETEKKTPFNVPFFFFPTKKEKKTTSHVGLSRSSSLRFWGFN